MYLPSNGVIANVVYHYHRRRQIGLRQLVLWPIRSKPRETSASTELERLLAHIGEMKTSRFSPSSTGYPSEKE